MSTGVFIVGMAVALIVLAIVISVKYDELD